MGYLTKFWQVSVNGVVLPDVFITKKVAQAWIAEKLEQDPTARCVVLKVTMG